MDKMIERGAWALAIATCFAGSALGGAAGVYASPVSVDVYAYEDTVLLSEIADEVDSIPDCVLEDGSDIIPAIAGRCIWHNEYNAYLTYEDRSYLIIDDTAGR